MLTIGCEAAGRHCMPMDILGAMNKSPRSLMLVAAACALLVLTACGNKGPLVMPSPAPAEAPAAPPVVSPVEGDPVPVDAPPVDAPATAPRTDGGNPGRR